MTTPPLTAILRLLERPSAAMGSSRPASTNTAGVAAGPARIAWSSRLLLFLGDHGVGTHAADLDQGAVLLGDLVVGLAGLIDQEAALGHRRVGFRMELGPRADPQGPLQQGDHAVVGMGVGA